MKKLLLSVCILITINTYSQPFASFESTTKGFGINLGFQSNEGVQVAGGFNVSITRADVADIYYGSVGYNILLSHKDEDNFSITPTIGPAFYSKEVFDANYNGKTEKGFKPIFGLELGKDWYDGRLFILANRCDKFYYGIGIKYFIN